MFCGLLDFFQTIVNVFSFFSPVLSYVTAVLQNKFCVSWKLEVARM